MKHKLTLIALLTIVPLNGSTISGIGYADFEKEAKKEALSDLSNKISVDVKTNFKTITSSMGEKYSKSKEKLVDISSNLPIIGASFDTLVGNSMVKSTAVITSNDSLKLYKSELLRLNKNISHGMLEFEISKSDDVKYSILNNLLNDIENFNKHKAVAILLSKNSLSELPILSTTKSEILAKLQKYMQDVPTIKIAAQILTKGITQKNIYVSGIKPNGSSEVTQFSRVLKNSMLKRLNSSKDTSHADYFIRGNYEILGNSIFVTTKLMNSSNKVIKTLTVSLHKNAYKNTRYKPSIKTFDNALNSEFIKSGKLNVQVGFRGFSRADGIDLAKDDTVDIIVKTNKPMCYFLLGHTLHDDKKFSYLLFGDGEINNITGEDVNRNITVADNVPISKPFGSENLQIFSSTFTKKGSCPLVVPICKEDEDGYCVVTGTPSKVMKKTRGLNMSKKKYKIEKAENSISWTSFKE